MLVLSKGVSSAGIELINAFLTYNPKRRIDSAGALEVSLHRFEKSTHQHTCTTTCVHSISTSKSPHVPKRKTLCRPFPPCTLSTFSLLTWNVGLYAKGNTERESPCLYMDCLHEQNSRPTTCLKTQIYPSRECMHAPMFAGRRAGGSRPGAQTPTPRVPQKVRAWVESHSPIPIGNCKTMLVLRYILCHHMPMI